MKGGIHVKQKVQAVNAGRKQKLRGRDFSGTSHFYSELKKDGTLALDFLIAPPRMAYYMEYSTRIYSIYMKYVAPEEKKKAEKERLARERKLQEAELTIKKRFGKNAILKGMNFQEGATARLTDRRIELDEYEVQHLDERKDGGEYITVNGQCEEN